MKYAKMLALAAVAAGALMAFIGAGTASATVLCSTTASPCPAGQVWPVGTEIDFSIPSGGSLLMADTEGGTLVTCTSSTVKLKLSTLSTGPVEEWTWNSCTWPTTTKKLGKLEVRNIAGMSNGTVVADGTFEVTILNFAGTCVYGVTSGTSLGDITEGKPAIFHTNAVIEEFTNNVFCPNTGRVTATYALTSPSNTTFSASS